ncbi:MAG: hypothetical protein ILA39_01050 [Bacteroidaceae bacterium]|nr:hypothetical protein [Bacteroidaceae bacterium]
MNKFISNTIAGVAIMATLLLAASCSDDDNEYKQYLTKGNTPMPEWQSQEPDYGLFEQTMAVQVGLQTMLLPYASEADLMCATIGGEVRAVTALGRTGGQIYFPLVIAGHSSDAMVSIHYYCAQLQRIYSVNDWQPFKPGFPPTNGGALYIPPFIPEVQ